MKIPERKRSENRSLIDGLYNGVAPYTPEEEKANKIYVNVNWKEGTNVLHAARGQYENAFLKPGNFFKVTIDDCPVDKQQEWSQIVTAEINRPLKASPHFLHTQRSKFASVVLHGPGITMWEDEEKVLPFFVGMEDVLMPTDTLLTMENVQYFAVRRKMKPGDLYKKTLAKGEHVDPGWKLDKVKKILNDVKGLYPQGNNYNWTDHPEQMMSLLKQNSSYYSSDRAKDIWFWDFYHLVEGQEKLEPGWYRKIILDQDCKVGNATSEMDPNEFIYERNQPFAESLSAFVHFQFGDGNNVPPFKYHETRSLGWILFDLIHLMNRLRCQFTQHVFDAMMMLFRCNDPADRARIQRLMLQNMGIIPEGVGFVPASDRYTVDGNLVNGLMSSMKQLVTESSSTYTQQLDTGTQKERTKFEVEALISQMSFLMTSMLNLAYFQEYFSSLEICRRFTIKGTMDFMAKKFKSACIKQGVPSKYLDSRRWTIMVEQVLGGGNKMLELAQARELRGMRPTLDPNAQREVDRIYIGALTDNSRLASSLVPDAPQVTDSIHDAELTFGTLMQGVPVSLKEGVNNHEQVTTLLRLMGQVIQRIMSTDNVGTPQDVIGLNNVASYVNQRIELLAQDEEEKAAVKEYSEMLSNFMNFVKGFEQRQQQAAKEKANQPDPEVIANIQAMMKETQAKLATLEAKNNQALQQKQEKHELDMRIKSEAAANEATIRTATAATDIKIKEQTAEAQTEIAKKQAAEKPAPAGNGE